MDEKILKEKERIWWGKNTDEESELLKPNRNAWEHYRWKKIMDRITTHYDFREKKVFVGCCGTGIFEESIYRYEPHVIESVGLDLTPKFINLAMIRNTGNPRAKFVVGDLEITNLENRSFDVAVVIDGLHHVPRPDVALKEMKRIAKGLILYEPNAINPIGRYKELKYIKQDVKESSFYEWRLVGTLKKLGYIEIVVINTGFVPQFIPRQLMAAAYFVEHIAEHIPILNKMSGSFLIIASC